MREQSTPKQPQQYNSFEEFYPFYISQHRNDICRRLHFIGTTLAMFLICLFVVMAQLKFALYSPIVGYSFAWVGHFFFEKNKPATFKYPVFSLMGDFRLWMEIATGKRQF